MSIFRAIDIIIKQNETMKKRKNPDSFYIVSLNGYINGNNSVLTFYKLISEMLNILPVYIQSDLFLPHNKILFSLHCSDIHG